MKDYQKQLSGYDPSRTILIKHQWGQNAASLYNQVVEAWNSIEVGDKMVITSNKRLGLKSAIKFFKRFGVEAKVVAKGSNNIRLLEIEKSSSAVLKLVEVSNLIEFTLNKKEYKANTGSAIFAKEKLDDGTRFLLETILSHDIDLNDKSVADFGAGWGAISLVISREFPRAKTVAYEIDKASCQAAKENLKDSSVVVECRDLTSPMLNTSKKHSFDYIISNPPFHVTTEEREAMFKNMAYLLKPGGGITVRSREFLFGAFSENNRTVFCN